MVLSIQGLKMRTVICWAWEQLSKLQVYFYTEKYKSLSEMVNHNVQHMQQIDGLVEASKYKSLPAAIVYLH